MDDMTVIERESLRKTKAIWAFSFFSSCTMFAAAQFEENGEISKGFAGHFGVDDVSVLPKKLLVDGDYSPSKTVIFMAGMSQRTRVETLRKTCESLCRGLRSIGFPTDIFWSSEDYPHFYNPEKSGPIIVSDIGLGLKGNATMTRAIYAGFSAREAIMLSLHCNTGIVSSRMNILTRDQGMITIGRRI